MNKKINSIRILGIIISSLSAWIFSVNFFWVISSWLLIMFLLEKFTDKEYHSSFEYFILVFLILSNYMGGQLGFYDTVPWWDEMLHFSYGFVFAWIGYKIISDFLISRHVKKDIFIIILFSFCFSVTIGVLWEVYEYIADLILKNYFIENGITFMQADLGSSENRITDTMNDLIIEIISAFSLNIIVFFYLTRKQFKKIMNYHFIKK